MATAMLKCVAKRGRVYHCTICSKKDEKARIEVHFYKSHVTDYNVPFKCVPCEFKCGDASKKDKHINSAGHLEKCNGDIITAALSIIESPDPKVLRWGEDVLKLSREESKAHWLSVGCNKESPAEERVLDQILATEDEDIFSDNSRSSSPSGKPVTEAHQIVNHDVLVQTEMKMDDIPVYETVKALELKVETLEAVIKKQDALLVKLLDKSTKAYDMLCSVRREQDRCREREARRYAVKNRDRSRSRHRE